MDPLLAAMEGIVDDLYGHVHRVSSVAVEVGREMALPPDDLDRLTVVGVLHDVGKIHVDPTVLAKPGPLVGPELAHMRTHPELGYAMTVDRFDKTIADAILYHHERYDGAGYPFGLRGEEIPMLARIVLVADAFDAITSHRCYQPALPVSFALEEIRANAGSQFDPGVVEAFFTVMESGRIRRRPPSVGIAAS